MSNTWPYILWRVLWIFPGISGKKREKHYLSPLSKNHNGNNLNVSSYPRNATSSPVGSGCDTVVRFGKPQQRKRQKWGSREDLSAPHQRYSDSELYRMFALKNICDSLSSCRWGRETEPQRRNMYKDPGPIQWSSTKKSLHIPSSLLCWPLAPGGSRQPSPALLMWVRSESTCGSESLLLVLIVFHSWGLRANFCGICWPWLFTFLRAFGNAM